MDKEKIIELIKQVIPSDAVSFDYLDDEKKTYYMRLAYEIVDSEFSMLSRNVMYGDFTPEDRIKYLKELTNGYVKRIEEISSSATTELKIMLSQFASDINTQIFAVSEGVIEAVEEIIAPRTIELHNDSTSDDYDEYYFEKQVKQIRFGLQAGDIVKWDIPGSTGIGIIKSFVTTPFPEFVNIQLLSEKTDGSFSLTEEVTKQPLAILQKREDTIVKETTGSFNIIKSFETGRLFWYGTFTNKYKDRHNEIIADHAHRTYVENVNSGLIPMPPLVFWHIPKAIGTTDFIEYLEEGFVAAGGFIYEQYEELFETVVKSVAESGERLGMSHHSKGLEKDGVISFYYSDEITILPLQEAANSLTAASITNKESE